MKGHGTHMAICVGLMALGAVAAIAGLGALRLLAGAGCGLMMVMMAWMVLRGARS